MIGTHAHNVNDLAQIREAVKEKFLLFLMEKSRDNMGEESLAILLRAAATAFDRKYKRDLLFRERCGVFLFDDEGKDKIFCESILKDLMWDGSLREELKKNDNNTEGK